MRHRERWNQTLGYFLTFTTYGTWLHGDERGSVDRKAHELILPDARLHRLLQDQLKYAPITLDAEMRRVVREAIEECCEFKGWTLIRLNVRTNHVHCIVRADDAIGRVLNALKARATRLVREAKLIPAQRPLWTEGGNKRELKSEQALEASFRYVADGQGPDLPES